MSGRKRKPSPGLYLTDVALRRDRIGDIEEFPFCLPSIRGLETNLPLHPRALEFLALMHDFCKQGSRFLITTHSPIIMAYPDAWIYVLSQEGIRRVPYAETDHYLVTRGF